MAKEKHSEGVQKGKFCALRKDNCGHNKYRQNCTPSPAGWSEYFFWQKGSTGYIQKVFEAHHLLCVSCVTEVLGNGRGIQQIVRQTDWCINKKQNMFAMPLWGHTVKWYCKIEVEETLAELPAAGRIRKRRKAPPFENIPQHDYDHNSAMGYTWEVKTELKKVAKNVKEQKTEDHEADAESLKQTLDDLAGDYRDLLEERGSDRTGGTHAAWKQGMKDPSSDWYLPFSMADDGNVEPRSFPTALSGGKKLLEKIEALVQAYLA